jgi:translation initiation factor 1
MNGGLIYTSDEGRICPACERPIDACQCKSIEAVPENALENNSIVRLSLDRKGRKGKGVTLITGIPLAPSELKAFAKKLKKKCGSGGAVKDGTIEIQGDHIALLLTELASLGYTVRRSGG